MSVEPEREGLAGAFGVGEPAASADAAASTGRAARRVRRAARGAAASAAHAGTLQLVARLCEELDAASVSYCHWKSNQALDRSARGDNDLDLLVRRRDAQRFAEILRRLGFKEARVPPAKELPGVFHAYGLDDASGRLVHVHAQYQLVLGDDMTKGYRLPVEEAYLASSTSSGVFRIPSAEWELAVFVVRMMLKHATWDAIASGQGELSRTERAELRDLLARADRDAAQGLVAEHLPFVGIELFERCLACLRRGGRSAAERARTASLLERRLAACSRRSRAADTSLKLWRRAVSGARRYVVRRRARKRLDAGGALIAIVGGDGAGKSSAVDELSAWLSDAFVTHRVHLGKPPRSPASLVVKGVIAFGRKLGAYSDTAIPAHEMPDGGDVAFPGYAWLLWHVLTARDRAREYARARRLATNGALVVCDRYPMPQLRYMEAARTTWLAGSASLPPLARRLVALEGRYYERIAEPEIAIVLRVNPEVAVERRPDQDAVFVRRRSDEVWRTDWSATRACVVDAGDAPERVLAEIKSIVWSRL
jgi:thymidylate kinase